jgi:protein-disulfide isomerase
MKKQTFVKGTWTLGHRSRGVRWALILIAAVGAGILAGRALGDRADAPAKGEKPSKGTTVTQTVDLAGDNNPGFIADIPNVDFTGLTPEQKQEAVKVFNARGCNCNCGMTLAQCRRDDKSCPRSPEIVARYLAAIKKGESAEQAAARMYGEAGAAPAANPAPAPGAAPAAAPAAPPAAPGKLVVYKVDAGNGPAIGPASAPVTIVKFNDYQCPFCARAHDTVKRILQEYSGKVRVVYKQHPLPMHPQATIASEVALAAQEQGRFEVVHEKLFAAQGELGKGRERILALAGEAGADVKKLAAALDSGKFRAVIEADSKQAEQLGATGTPAFFVNGRYISGARPFEQFKPIIDEELAGKRPTFEWGTNVQNERAAAQAAQARAQQELQNKVHTIDLAGAVSTGPEKAPVTIVEFTDFQCPFCQRAQGTVKQVLQEYKGKVRFVAKNLPLGFHPQARPAARAALAAHRQGKYWEYRDLLFANNRNLNEEAFLAHAKSVGLNVDRFKADMASPEIDKMITTDEQQAQQVGATGTPTFLINGRLFVGAQPFEAFKQRIDAELAGAKPASKGR